MAEPTYQSLTCTQEVGTHKLRVGAKTTKGTFDLETHPENALGGKFVTGTVTNKTTIDGIPVTVTTDIANGPKEVQDVAKGATDKCIQAYHNQNKDTFAKPAAPEARHKSSGPAHATPGQGPR